MLALINICYRLILLKLFNLIFKKVLKKLLISGSTLVSHLREIIID